jgi:histo-blood group ABO system transferase
MKIAIVLVATGRLYRHFLNPIIPQIKELFTTHPKDIFLVSDLPKCPGVHEMLHVEHLPVPLPSLLRYHWICRLRRRLLEYDYLYYLDVDAEILKPIGDEILRPLIAVRHWRWPKRELTTHATFETRPESLAYVDPQTVAGYFHGSFQGGKMRHFLRTARILRDRINQDLTNRGKGRGGMIAVWYDESHWNRFVNDNFDLFHVLGPEYASVCTSSRESSIPFIRLRCKDEDHLWSWSEE